MHKKGELFKTISVVGLIINIIMVMIQISTIVIILSMYFSGKYKGIKVGIGSGTGTIGGVEENEIIFLILTSVISACFLLIIIVFLCISLKKFVYKKVLRRAIVWCVYIVAVIISQIINEIDTSLLMYIYDLLPFIYLFSVFKMENEIQTNDKEKR